MKLPNQSASTDLMRYFTNNSFVSMCYRWALVRQRSGTSDTPVH